MENHFLTELSIRQRALGAGGVKTDWIRTPWRYCSGLLNVTWGGEELAEMACKTTSNSEIL